MKENNPNELKSRRGIRGILAIGIVVAVAAMTGAGSMAQQYNRTPRFRPTLVLVHGAWADGSSWNDVTRRLQHEGYTVNAIPNTLRSIAADASYVANFLKSVQGPIVLVAHSYGGAVITNAAFGNPNVKALVYIDAFVPDQGESPFQLVNIPPPSGQDKSCVAGDSATTFTAVQYPGAPQGDVDLYIKPELFPTCFADDLHARQAGLLAASQRPVTLSALLEASGKPAWKTIPSWYLIGTTDKVIPPYLQEFMAKRANANISHSRASHVSMLSEPDDVVDLIEDAVRGSM